MAHRRGLALVLITTNVTIDKDSLPRILCLDRPEAVQRSPPPSVLAQSSRSGKSYHSIPRIFFFFREMSNNLKLHNQADRDRTLTMASDEEKPPISSSQPSSNGQYLDESRSTIKQQTEDEVPPGEKPGSAEKDLGSNVIKIADTVEDPFAHLPPHEQAILKAQVDTPVVNSGVKTLYRYGTMKDFFILVVSAVCAIASGAALPLMSIVFGSLASQFNGYFQGTISRDTFDHILTHRVLYFVYLSIGEFFTVYISTIGFIYTGDHITGKIRAHYLEACMRQNIAFFDKLGSGEITTRITADTNLVQDGISEKLGLILNAIGTFVTAFTIGFIKSWKLTLILSSSVVANTIAMGAGSRFIIKYSKQSIELHALGGSIAEEVISSIRNATAFGTQNKLARQYDRYLAEGEKSGRKVKFALGIMVGAIYLLINLNYGLAFWMGSRFLVDNEIDLTSIISILMSIMMGALALGNVAPNFQAFTTAIAAATKIFNTVDRVSPLDATSHKGIKLEYIEGTLELRNIKHIYPSRPEVTVMNGVSLTIPAGKMTALVGPSGSGKSTIIGLVERFYNPVGGQILLDGHDISSLNLGWLRQQISLVSQEPTLFNTTIFQNIAHGLTRTKWQNEKEETKRELIVSAAKIANAHGFISKLPNGYQTDVGERGFLLSGGQKQRIAIARAVVSDPKSRLHSLSHSPLLELFSRAFVCFRHVL
jgi:ATP-binding cassette subfamily B (MDR/TAP) protein 1